MPLRASEIRDTFLRFFERKGHRIVSSSSLIPQSDPTLLFANAGMVQFKRSFLGEEMRDYVRATTSQKCMRVSGKHNDLENVGRTPRHHTFFEMLGNFSFGDYFKEKAIEYAWELVTGPYGLPADRLVVSVFRDDDEAFALWRDLIGLPEEKIFRLDESENFWSMGDTGPCGPCTEIHYDHGPVAGRDRDDPSSDSGRFLEIWNLVFMQYDRDVAGKMTPLPKPCVDTGAGLERLAAVIQGVPSNYDTDLFRGILERAQEVAAVSRGEDAEKDVSLNVVADHARAVTFLVGDGVLPSNEGRGYVLRRILRRAARHGVLLGIEDPFLYRVADAVIDEMAPAYPELAERRAYITDRVEREEARFQETISKGLALLEEEIAKLRDKGERTLPGDVVFRLYDTFGFPVDLTEDVLRGYELGIDQAGFDDAMTTQRERARAAWKGSGDERVQGIYGELAAAVPTGFCGYDRLELADSVHMLLVDHQQVDAVKVGQEVEVVVHNTPFYAESGGQAGDRGSIETPGGRIEVADTVSPSAGLVVHRGKVVRGTVRAGENAQLSVDAEARAATVRNHSGTHLLHAALRQVLGPQAMQKGSLVAPDRLRFDFTHDAPLSDEEITAIEDLANRWIEENASGGVRVMSYSEAIESGATAIFEEKYGDQVRVVSFGDFSTELCGGTHAKASGDIGFLKILSESGIAAGVRRIEALTGLGALAHVRGQDRTLRELAGLLRVSVADLPKRVEKLLDDRRAAEKEIQELRSEKRGAASGDLSAEAREVGGIKLVTSRVDGVDPKALREMVDQARAKLGSGVVLLAAESEGGLALALGVTSDLKARFKAGDLMREVALVLGARGGGRPDFAQGGGGDPERLDSAFERLEALLSGG